MYSLLQAMENIFNKYISDTLSDICTIKHFLEEKEQWFLLREEEVEKMTNIKKKNDKISLTLGHIEKSKDKATAVREYVWSGLTSMTADSRRHKLEKELGAVLKGTLDGLEKMLPFLEAVGKLALTSPFVFADTCYLPKGKNANDVQSVISAARKTSPLLVHFNRDDKSFFLPDLNNLEVMSCQLQTYIQTYKNLCDNLQERTENISSVAKSWRVLDCDQAIKLNENSHGESIEKMQSHINQLNMIRNNQDVRLTFLFQKSAESFIGLFNQNHKRMQQFLSDLDECAKQLDKMKFGANIATVAGSSVGVVGGVLSIVGLALAPVTAGVSLALTLTGVGLGVTSGVNSVVTGITEIAVNLKHGRDAKKELECFRVNAQNLAHCLEKVASSEGPAIALSKLDNALKATKALTTLCAIGKGIDGLVDSASAVKVLQTEEVAVQAVKFGIQEAKTGKNIPKLAADLPNIGKMAKGTPLALSKAVRSGFIAANAIFIGVDIFSIFSGSISLSKGSKNEMAQLIRSRAALWRSELDSWKQMHDSLCRGLKEFSSSQKILEQPFYPH